MPAATLKSTQAYPEVAISTAEDVKAGRALVFPTLSFCCKPGTGAHQEGCSSA